jgi:hypothetical protein
MATRLPGHLQGPKNLDKTTSFSTPTPEGDNPHGHSPTSRYKSGLKQ